MLKTKSLLKLCISVVIVFFSIVFVFIDVTKAVGYIEDNVNVCVPSSIRIDSLDSDEYFHVDFDYFEDENSDFFKDGIIFPSEKTTGFSSFYKKEFLDEIFDRLTKTKLYRKKGVLSEIRGIIEKLEYLQNDLFDVNSNNGDFKKFIRDGEFDYASFSWIYSKIGKCIHNLLRIRNRLLNSLDIIKNVRKDIEQNNNTVPDETSDGKKLHKDNVEWIMECMYDKIEIKSAENVNERNITVLQAIEIIEKCLQGFIRHMCAECAYIELKFNFPFNYFLVNPEYCKTNEANLAIYKNDGNLKKSYTIVENNYRYNLGLTSYCLDRYRKKKNYFNSCEMFMEELYALDLHRRYVGEYINMLRCSKNENNSSSYTSFRDAMVKYNENYCESFKELSNFCLNIEKESFELGFNVLNKFFEFALDYEKLKNIKIKEEAEIEEIKNKIDPENNNGKLLEENYKRSSNQPVEIADAQKLIANIICVNGNELMNYEQFEKYYGFIQNAIDGVCSLTKYINSYDFENFFNEQYRHKLKLKCLEIFDEGVNDVNATSMSCGFSNLLKNNMAIIRGRIESVCNGLCNMLYKNTIAKITKFLANFLESIYGTCYKLRRFVEIDSIFGGLIPFIIKNPNYENIDEYYTVNFARPVFAKLFSAEENNDVIADRFKLLVYSLNISEDNVEKCKSILKSIVNKLLSERNKSEINKTDDLVASFELKKVEPLICIFRKVIDIFEKYIINYKDRLEKFNKILDDGCSSLKNFKLNAKDIFGIKSFYLEKEKYINDPIYFLLEIRDIFKPYDYDLKTFMLYFAALIGLAYSKNKEQDISNVNFTMPKLLGDYTINLQDYEKDINN